MYYVLKITVRFKDRQCNEQNRKMLYVVLNYIGLKKSVTFFCRREDDLSFEAKLRQRLRNNVSAGVEVDCCSIV